MGQLQNDLELFRSTSDHLGSFWDHLGSSGIIWEHLGSSATICNHLNSSRLTWDHLGSSRIIPGSIWDLRHFIRWHRSPTVDKSSINIARSVRVFEGMHHQGMKMVNGWMRTITRNSRSNPPVHTRRLRSMVNSML